MSERSLPLGYCVRLGAHTHRCRDGVTVYGHGRMLRLRPAAQQHLAADGSVEVVDASSRALARLLLARGLADPCWSTAGDLPQVDARVTVVVPVLDRASELDRLLNSLPSVPVIVVDDGSADPDSIAAVCRRHGAQLLRQSRTAGPAAARNRGLRAVQTDLVAFVDSDVVLEPDTLGVLLRHLQDPQVGLVAPRVRGLHEGGGALERYEAARSSLDLGPHAALVRPHAPVSYVPSAMLLARTAAVGDGFEESMQVAEDVDLVWRVGQRWAVRYEPAAVARHEHRTSARSWLGRKACYGSGAALLAARHGPAVAPAILTPWSAAVTFALLAQRRWSLPIALGVTAATHQRLATRLASSSREPQRAAAQLLRAGVRGTVRQAGSSVTRHYLPVTAALAPFSRRARRAYLVAAVVGGLADYRADRPDLDPVRYVALRAADDLAYGLGLWHGAMRARSVAALTPLLRSGSPTTPPPRPSTTRTKGTHR